MCGGQTGGMNRVAVVCGLLLLGTGCSTTKSLAVTMAKTSLVVTSDGEPFATYCYGESPRPYIWPLFAPGGIAVTRDHPMVGASGPRTGESKDHPHHQSLWLAHGDVDGFDFWHGKKNGERIEFEFGSVQWAATGNRVEVTSRGEWLVGESRVIARERRRVAFVDHGDHRTIDVTVYLRPAKLQITIGDTKEGTFALRVHPALRVDGEVATGVLRNSEGATGKAVWGKRARWIDDSGVVDGKPVGVAMFDHPDNPRHPTWWHARTYGLLAANPFGVHDFEKKPDGAGDFVVKRGEVLALQYRVLLHGEGWDDARIEAAYERWARGL